VDESSVVKLNGSNLYTLSYIRKRKYVCVCIYAMMVPSNEEEDPKVLRKKAKLTVRSVSLALGVTETTVTRWEAGIYAPTLSLKQGMILMKLYDCSIEQLDRAFSKAQKERASKIADKESSAAQLVG
jgi:DNA-binding XRE family transcriptional regulator